jgi:hypothetical protein
MMRSPLNDYEASNSAFGGGLYHDPSARLSSP